MERENSILKDISLYVVIRELLANLWIAVLVFLSVWIGIDAISSLRYIPEYTSTATLVVNAKENSSVFYSNLSTAKQMAGVLSKVFSSEVLRNKIAQDLGVETISATIEAQVITETNLMNISVTAGSAKQAHMILKSALSNYDTISEYLFSNATLKVLRAPSVPTTPSNQKPFIEYQKKAAVAAGLLVCILAVVVSIMRSTIKTTEAAKEQLLGRVIGEIPFERKSKSLRNIFKKRKNNLIFGKNTLSMPFSESIRKTATRIELYLQKEDKRVLMISSAAEDEGKTSVAANLAIALAEKGKKVALLDGDFKKPAIYKSYEKNLNGQKVLSDFLQGNARWEDICRQDEKTKVFLVLQDKTVEFSEQAIASPKMQQLVEILRLEMDYVIVDSAPMSVTSDTECLLQYVDAVAWVVRQDWAPKEQINGFIEEIENSDAEFLGIILNGFRQENWLADRLTYGYSYKYNYSKYSGREHDGD